MTSPTFHRYESGKWHARFRGRNVRIVRLPDNGATAWFLQTEFGGTHMQSQPIVNFSEAKRRARKMLVALS